MNLSELGKTVAKFAPFLGAVLPVPGAAILGNAIGAAFGGDVNDPQDLINKINNTDPTEAKIKLVQIQNQHEEMIANLQLENNKVIYGDIANARQREVELAKAGKPDETPKILALAYTSGFFLIMFLFSLFPQLKDNTVTMALLSGQMLILGYYFGSSVGSKNKEQQLIKLSSQR